MQSSAATLSLYQAEPGLGAGAAQAPWATAGAEHRAAGRAASPGGTQRPAVPVPCDSSTAGRETSTRRQKYRTLQWLFPRQSCIWVRQSCMSGATSLSEIFIPFPFFPLTILTPDFLADVSITAAFVLTYQCHCSMLLLHTSGNEANQEAPSEIIFFASERTFPSLASSSWSGPGWRIWPSPPSASTLAHAGPGQSQAAQSRDKLQTQPS